MGSLLAALMMGWVPVSSRGGISQPQVARASERKRARSSLANGSETGSGKQEVMRVLPSKLQMAESFPAWDGGGGDCPRHRRRSGGMHERSSPSGRCRNVDARQRTRAGAPGRWRQGKTGHCKEAGAPWPEIGAILDEYILEGRPRRHAQQRFEELRGCNWLSLADEPYASRWPSVKVKDAVGVPFHDLRTLAADYLRMHDPVTAPRIVTVLLGQRTQEAGREYHVLGAETAAQREWQEIRELHGAVSH